MSSTKIHFHCDLMSGDFLIKKNCCVDLIFEDYGCKHIELRVFVDTKAPTLEMLNRMLEDVDVGNYIKVIDVDGRYENIDLRHSEILSVRTSSNWDYIRIEVSKVKYEWLRYEEREQDEMVEHSFFLNSSAKKLSPVIYTEFDGKGKWEDLTKRKRVNADEFSFIFSNEYYKTESFRQGNGKLELGLSPILNISVKRQLGSDEVIRLAEIICMLVSFYRTDRISFYKAVVNRKSSQELLVRKIESGFDRQSDYSYTTGSDEFGEFFNSIEKFSQIRENQYWWKRNVEKSIIANYINGESRFLILYNILEHTLDYLRKSERISKSTGIQYFEGLSSNARKIKNLCRNLVEQIKGFIPEENLSHRDAYAKQNEKIGFYKDIVLNKSLLRSGNKIQLILKELEIDHRICGIDSISKLVSLRDDLVHGNREVSFQELRQVNIGLSKLSNFVLLKLLVPQSELPE